MPANLSSTGPIHMYIRVPTLGAGPRGATSAGAISYLGTCREYPKISVESKWLPVKNDIGGDELPFDYCYVGEDASVEADLGRWDHTVLQAILNNPRMGRALGGSARGSNTRLDRGVLAGQNRISFELWCHFSFAGTINAVDYPDMIPGFYWPSVLTVGSFNDPVGTRDACVRVMFKPMNWYLASTGGFMLYSNDPLYFASLPGPN